ncbi:MAG TPA: lipopolysaccharide biosynthesis protein [Planctomycetota bacterium]|nr:lipopolysaccharide biosynthesis protein [Planctomycetota bacterium]
MRQKLKELHGRKFVRDALVLWIATGVQGASYLGTSVLTKRFLGMHEKGRWDTTRDLYGFAYFFVTMGLVSAAVSRYSEAMGRRDHKACVSALAGMLKIGLLAATLVTVGAYEFGPAISGHYYDDREVGHYAAILCLAGVFEVVRGLTVVALQGTRQMREFAWFDITSSAVRLGLVFFALLAGYGVPGVVWAFFAHMVVAGGIALFYYRRARRGDPRLAPPPLSEVLAATPRASMHNILGISYLMALNKGMNSLVPLVGGLLIPAMKTLQSTGEAFSTGAAYRIGYVLAWGLGLAMTGVTQSLLPALGLKLGKTDTPFDQMGGLLRRVSLTAGFLMVGATLLSIPVMYFVVRFLYGADAQEAFRFYCWLTAGNLFIGFTTVIDAFYIYSGRLKFAVRVNFLLAGLALGGILLGGKLYGPIGVSAAVALCDAMGLFHLVYMWLYFRRAKARNGPSAATPDLTHD